jgi:hypothetical protein
MELVRVILPIPALRVLSGVRRVVEQRANFFGENFQAHNLKVIGSNPIPATRQQALENKSFSRAFCCSKFGWKFHSWKHRGSGRRKVAA